MNNSWGIFLENTCMQHVFNQKSPKWLSSFFQWTYFQIFWEGKLVKLSWKLCMILKINQISLCNIVELTHLNFVKLPGCLITILMKFDFGIVKFDFGKLLICCVIICAKISLSDFMLQVIKSFISQVKSNFILNIRIHNDKKIIFNNGNKHRNNNYNNSNQKWA